VSDATPVQQHATKGVCTPAADRQAEEASDINWSLPWYAPWAGVGREVHRQWRQGRPLWDCLNTANAPVRFVPADALPRHTAFESFVARTGACPTRPGLHDFFNGLCWIGFPATKARLNQLQAASIAQDGIGPRRGALRDAITLFDENAALLRAPDALWDALAAKAWQRVFIDLRPLWRDAWLLVFGHALLQKLLRPHKPVTAHVYRVHPGADDLAALDLWLAHDLDAARLAGRPFAHLPVLGVPGWWPANEDHRFYDDPAVFRAARAQGAGPITAAGVGFRSHALISGPQPLPSKPPVPVPRTVIQRKK